MFGKRRDPMSQEPKETTPEKPTPPATSGRPAKREVELFPPIAERNLNSPPAGITAGSAQGGRLATQISMFQPVSFEEALDIVEALRSRNATTISLEKLKKNDANRLVDFVAGASAALDGDFHKMTEQVFVFCPANIKIVATSAAATTGSAQRSAAMAGPMPGPSASSTTSTNFSLDTLFPDMSQGGGLSTLWGKQ